MFVESFAILTKSPPICLIFLMFHTTYLAYSETNTTHSLMDLRHVALRYATDFMREINNA